MLGNQCSSENLKDKEKNCGDTNFQKQLAPLPPPAAHPVAGLKAMSVSFILHTNILHLYFLNHLHIFIQENKFQDAQNQPGTMVVLKKNLSGH